MSEYIIISDLLRDVDKLPNDQIIYAVRSGGVWVPESPITLVPMPAGYPLSWGPTQGEDIEGRDPTPEEYGIEANPIRVGDRDYFLDTNIVKEFVAGWRATPSGRVATLRETADRLIEYAVNDA